jgi:hypothetical protein
MTVTEQIFITKANGKREPFDETKLMASLARAGAVAETIENIVGHVREELYDGMTTSDIYSHAFAMLHKWKQPVAAKYSIRRAIMELGPTGFPFEKFVGEILKARGFEVLTGQEVLGKCVPHEVDVVAWNDEKLIMAEAKYHNQLGVKSDLKVALYVKARFDDLKGNTFNYGGKDRQLTDGWLITNTKFSSTAIHYGVCENLTMIGWNYPEKGNLQDMIEEFPHLLELLKIKEI